MKKAKIKALVIAAILIGLFVFVLFKTGIMMSINNAMNKLSGTATITKTSKPIIINIINSSGEEKVNEDVVVFIDVMDTSKIKNIEYSLDTINWRSVDSITKDNDIMTGKVVFTKNMKKTVYVRAINEYNNVSDYKTTKVIIEK